MNKPPQAIIPSLILALIFLAAGVFTLLYFILFLKSAKVSAGWPVVAGQLIKSSISKNTGSSGGSKYGSATFSSRSYNLSVEYRYTAGKKEYTGTTFSFEPGTDDRKYWEDKAGKYIAGTSVYVYYNPHDPSESVLETGGYEKNYVFILMGLFFTGYGGYQFYQIIRKSRTGNTAG